MATMRVFVTDIQPGVIFDTEYETNCKALESPRDFGNFDGIDSNGIWVEFNASMVIKIHKKGE